MDEISSYKDLVVIRHNFHNNVALIRSCTNKAGALAPRLF